MLTPGEAVLVAFICGLLVGGIFGALGVQLWFTRSKADGE
jgi:hypothetical protein